jgi:hypothetical protein
MNLFVQWLLFVPFVIIFIGGEEEPKHYDLQKSVHSHHGNHSTAHRPSLHPYIQIFHFIDSISCNNDPTDHYLKENYRCFNEHNQEKECDERKSVMEGDCQLVHLKLLSKDSQPLHEHLIHRLLYELFLKTDSNKVFRKVIIEFPNESHLFVSKTVDQLITSRPWFSVTEEEFPQLLSSRTTFRIVLDRFHSSFEDYFKLLSLVQYPDQLTCDSTPFMLNRKLAHPGDSGWASITHMYFILEEEIPFGIVHFYVTRSNFLNESNGFISSPSDCPHLKNKWECAFLPTTNCSLPSFLKDCHSRDCIQQFPDSQYYSVLFSNYSDSSGNYLSREKNETEFLRIKQLGTLPRNSGQAKAALDYNSQQQRFSLTYLVPATYDAARDKLLRDPLSMKEVFNEQFFLRKNSFYRLKIQEYLLKEFYPRFPSFQSPKERRNFSEPRERRSFHCIAAHIRRGDRTVFGVNMTEYCSTHKQHEDAGCNSKVPFGTVSLPQLVEKAKSLLSNKQFIDEKKNKKKNKKFTLLVASDDPLWLEEQKELFDQQQKKEKSENESDNSTSDWEVATVFPSKQFNLSSLFPKNSPSIRSEKDYQKYIWHIRTDAGTTSGVYFHAMIELVQQCDGFIGHFGSGIGWMLYRSMCYRNNLGMALCPPVYDLRSGV